MIKVDIRSKHSAYITIGKWVIYIDNSTGEHIIESWKESDPNSGWVHCSFSLNGNRKQYLKAYKENGRTKYEHIL